MKFDREHDSYIPRELRVLSGVKLIFKYINYNVYMSLDLYLPEKYNHSG